MDYRFFIVLFLAFAVDVPRASGRSTARHLGYYKSPSPSSGSSPVSTPSTTPSYSPPSSSGGGSPSSGSSPVIESPPSSYTPPSSGSSPVVESPPSYTPPSSGSSPVVESPPSYTPPSSGSSPVVEGPSSSYTPPSSGSSPIVESPPSSGSSPVSEGPSSPSLTPPYGSSPSSGSSPVVASPLGSPIIGAPSSSPVIGSPFSSPVVGSPITSPVIGSPLSTPTPIITTPSSGGYGGGGKGSCGFWSSNRGKFPSVLSAFSTLGRLFGGRALSVFGGRMTLMQALLNPNHDEYSALARQGSASLLNAYTFQSFRFTPSQVREQFNTALESPEAARQQALVFEQANLAV